MQVAARRSTAKQKVVNLFNKLIFQRLQLVQQRVQICASETLHTR